MVYKPYQLFPAWIEKKALADLENVIRSLAPFTVTALGGLKGPDNKKFEEKMTSAMKAIDALFSND
jgi:phosphoribosyl-dephospho-CoA transferase